MYKVTFKPNYDEPIELGKASNMEEAVELIGSFCVARHYTLEDYVIKGNIHGWMLDPKTQEDYFYILPVEK